MKYTEVEYMYRDNENNKKSAIMVLEGELSDNEVQEIYEKCRYEAIGDTSMFIPTQVGLPEVRFDDFQPDIDGPWCELLTIKSLEAEEKDCDSVLMTFTAQQLLENFRAVEKWNENTVSQVQTATPSEKGGRAPLTGYERFQLQWMMDHGYSLKALMDAIHEFWSDPCVPNDTIPELFREWEQDVGFGSEIWPCEAEYLASAESADDAYRKVKEFEAYQKENDMEDIKGQFEFYTDSDIEETYGMTRKEIEPLFPEMAVLMRKRIDDSDEWTYHRDYAIKETLRQHKKQ